MDLNTIWFILIAVLLIGYAVLDGFDLGVGILHLTAKTEEEKRLGINAIGPVWDGNEVWLLTGGGALFAAFPIVYATVFSSFYLALMLLLVALIGRAVSFEFRRQIDSARWKAIWDNAFAFGSLVAALLFGVAFGNILRGIPINGAGLFTGNFFTLLNPYALLIGIFGLTVFIQHGAFYLGLKTNETIKSRMQKIIPVTWIIMTVLMVLIFFFTFFAARFLYAGLLGKPLFWVTFIAFWLSMVMIPIAVKSGDFWRGWLASAVSIAGLLGMGFTALYPRLTPSSLDLANSLTVYNASSTPRTLTVMLIIALIGMPIVIGYTVYIYRVFKGKVNLSESHY